MDESLLFEFVEEARDHLSSLESEFMVLEKDLSNPDFEVINKIFRAIHTIKGSCGFFSLTSMGQLSHTMETLLMNLRDGVQKPSSDMLDALLSGVDLLNAMVGDIQNSNSMDISDVESQVCNFLDGDVKEEITIDHVAQSDEEVAHCEELLLKEIPSCEYLYELTYNLSYWEEQSQKNPLSLVDELLKTGDILQGEIVSDSTDLRVGIPEGDVVYRMYYRSVLDPGLIDGISQHAPVNIRQVVEAKVAQVEETEDVLEKQEDVPTKTEDKEESTVTVEQTAQSEKASETLRVKVDILNQLMMLAGELVLVRNQQLLHQETTDATSNAITQRLDVVTSELQETIMRTRMQPMGNVFGRFTRVVRDISKKLDKKIEIKTSGSEVELDKNILEALVDPLTHIIRNSCDHGIEVPEKRKASGKSEVGSIYLKAYHEGGQINIEISDDGNGVSVAKVKEKILEKNLKTEEEISLMNDKELISMILLPGFSTAGEVSDLSGRGVGMDVVKTSIEKLGGVIDITSVEGKGTTLNLRLPLTLAIIPSLIVEVDQQRFAIPQINLEELVCLYDEDVYQKVESVGNKEVYRLRDQLLPMVRLSELLNHPDVFTADDKTAIAERNYELRQSQKKQLAEAKESGNAERFSLNFAVLKFGDSRFGLIIDSIIGTEEIVVKPMHRAVKDLAIYAGATVLGDGKVALILDVLGLARHCAIDFDAEEAIEEHVSVESENGEKRSLLLFSNEGDERFAVNMGEVKRVEKVDMKDIERIGANEYATVDGSSTRIIRLDHCLPVSSGVEREEMFLILPKEARKDYGLLTSKLLDIGEFSVQMNQESFTAPGVEGSAILNEHMTLFINSEQLVLSSEGEWYQN